MRVVDPTELEEEPRDEGFHVTRSDIMMGVKGGLGVALFVVLLAAGCRACFGSSSSSKARSDDCYEHAVNLAPPDDDASSFISCRQGQVLELVVSAGRPIGVCRCLRDGAPPAPLLVCPPDAEEPVLFSDGPP